MFRAVTSKLFWDLEGREMVNFPASLDTPSNPASSSRLANATAALKHAFQHAQINDMMRAVQAKLGINNSQMASSIDYRVAALEAILGSQLSIGWPTFQRDVENSSFAMTTQGLRLAFFTAQKPGNTSGVRLYSAGTAAGATPTIVRVGLWTSNIAGDGIAQVAATVNNTGLLAALNTEYNQAWAAPYTMVLGQRYALGLLVVSAAAMPAVPSNATVMIPESAKAPMISALLPGQTNLPATWLAAALTQSTNRPYLVAT